MPSATRADEVADVDRLLAEPKWLDGLPPSWSDSHWGGEITAVWNVLDVLKAPVAQLRFTARKTNTAITSANLIYRQRTLWRLDMDESTTCHSNPHDAHSLDLPALVCGPHEHAWLDNRAVVLLQDDWHLPYRRPLPPTIRKLGQGLLWLADRLHITIEPEQRGFDGPTRADLFDRGGR